jgi:hypothetical protein
LREWFRGLEWESFFVVVLLNANERGYGKDVCSTEKAKRQRELNEKRR